MIYIDVPPPTISGDIHIGHIFSYTQGQIFKNYFDYISNNKTHYPFCFDNNGLSTIKLANKKKRQDVFDFSIEKSIEYFDNFTKAGVFLDKSIEYNTMSDKATKIIYSIFETLLNKGIIYKSVGEYLWSEKLRTSISQSELDENGLVEKTGEQPMVKTGESYYVKVLEYKEHILSNVDKIKWYPEAAKNKIIKWIQQLDRDWNISRNRSYGVPIPNEDNMVFDTWFISALTPNISSGNVSAPVFKFRFQSHDIIRSWAFYTIVMSLHINNQIPWESIIVTGQVIDGSGNKFSKSSGNATKADEYIRQYGINGIRWWSSNCSLFNDIKIDIEKMKMGWRIKNKFDNAIRFVNIQKESGLSGENYDIMQSYLKQKELILQYFGEFNIPEASNLIYKLLWNNICDVWIEESKINPYPDTLYFILNDFKSVFNIIFN